MREIRRRCKTKTIRSGKHFIASEKIIDATSVLCCVFSGLRNLRCLLNR
jgi:hypothetical protein